MSIILRTSALFILDWWYSEKNKLLFTTTTDYFTSFITNLILLNGLLLFFLPIRLLRGFYSHFICVGALLIAR